MYSQSNEEEVILKYFKGHKGRFLDIGAYDGKTFSNTCALAEKGWGGTCVEASPQCFTGLQKTYKGNSRVNLVCAAMMGTYGCQKFFDHGGATATTDVEHMKGWKERHGVPYQEIFVGAVTMSHLLHVLPGPYDFITIDAEGVDLPLVQALPQDMAILSTKLVCVEVCGESKEAIVREFTKRGFVQCAEFPLGSNLMFSVKKPWR